MPERIQRMRTKGFNLQAASPNGLPVVSVTRPGKWGNKFKVGMWFKKLSDDWMVWSHGDPPEFGNEQVRDLEHSLELFADYALKRLRWQRDWLEPLRGKNLACWCKVRDVNGDLILCHADILLRLANPEMSKCEHPSPSLAGFCDDCGKWIYEEASTNSSHLLPNIEEDD